MFNFLKNINITETRFEYACVFYNNTEGYWNTETCDLTLRETTPEKKLHFLCECSKPGKVSIAVIDKYKLFNVKTHKNSDDLEPDQRANLDALSMMNTFMFRYISTLFLLMIVSLVIICCVDFNVERLNFRGPD